MSTIKLEIDNSKLDTVLNIIQNLKDDLIAKYEVIYDNNSQLKKDHFETKVFSEHSASLIEDWHDNAEDDIWK